MTNEIREVLNDVVHASPRDKVDLACEAINKVHECLKKKGCNDDSIVGFICNLTRLFVSADLNCTDAEYSFFKAVTGAKLTPEQFYEMTNQGREESFLKDTFEIFSMLDAETKTASIIYGVAIISCDNEIDVDEVKMIDALMSV